VSRAPGLRAAAPLEHDEQAAFFALVDLHQARHPELACVYAVPNFSGRVGKLTAIHSAKLNREGRRRGVPDINVDVARHGCHGLRIEMKRANATASAVAPEQREWHARLTAQGYRVVVARGHREAWAALCEYLGIPNVIR
jgi:hypothetical protein